MAKALIRLGDMTTHGGKVIEGFSDYTIQNIPVAGVGHKTICPLCKGVFPIIQGYGGITVNGIFVALEGYVTACGAKLIPSQHEEVVDDGGGGDVMGAAAQQPSAQSEQGQYARLSDEQPEQTQYASLSDGQQSMINDGVYRPDQDQGGIAPIAADREDLDNRDRDGNAIDPVNRRAEFNDPNSSFRREWDGLNDRYDKAYQKMYPNAYSDGSSVSDPSYVPTERDLNDLRNRTEAIERDAQLKDQQQQFKQMSPEEQAQLKKNQEFFDNLQTPLKRFEPKDGFLNFPKNNSDDPKLPAGNSENQLNQPKNPSYQKTRNSPTTIDGRYYTGHALDRMQDRGIPPSVVEDTVKNNSSTDSRNSTRKFYSPSNNVTVITNSTGDVVMVRKGK